MMQINKTREEIKESREASRKRNKDRASKCKRERSAALLEKPAAKN